MGKTEHDKAEQVHSARVWLDKAERSFRSRSEIQGELNLLLAEAEMKNLRKNHGIGQRVVRFGAATTALVIAAALWVLLGPLVRHQPAVQPETSAAVPAAYEESRWIKAEPLRFDAKAAEAAVPAGKAAEQAGAEVGQTEPAEPESVPAETVSQAASAQRQAVMSSVQMQETVQAARHSLRSTESIHK